jgi:hypothetical protein
LSGRVLTTRKSIIVDAPSPGKRGVKPGGREAPWL